MTTELLERFVCGVAYGQQTPAGCLPWGGKPNANGYGVIGYKGGLVGAHRVAYELFVGQIPEGWTIDLLCRTRNCVEPTHLEAVPRSENMRRGAANGMTLWSPRCQDPEHHRVQYGNKNRCLECTRASQRQSAARYRAKRKEVG